MFFRKKTDAELRAEYEQFKKQNAEQRAKIDLQNKRLQLKAQLIQEKKKFKEMRYKNSPIGQALSSPAAHKAKQVAKGLGKVMVKMGENYGKNIEKQSKSKKQPYDPMRGFF